MKIHTKRIGKEAMKQIISKLDEVARIATMETSSFNTIGPAVQDDYPTCEKEVTDFIKKRTRNWRASWIIHPLNAIVEELKRKLQDLEAQPAKEK